MGNILKYSYKNARRFFLKEESYFNFDLPKYFVFGDILEAVAKKLGAKNLTDFYNSDSIHKSYHPSNCENVNYKFLNNKDGKYAWRPFQLIHPAIYVSLVNHITEKSNWSIIKKRFAEFYESSSVNCISIPLESKKTHSDKATNIINWWQAIEQKSIELALDFEYILHTDISDCYGSLYSHSIVWALHSKEIAKKERNNNKLIGNIIDKHLQNMSFGQTNGIPQGSVLMDFIAEMVLGFADFQLSKKIKEDGIVDYKIIRYRDDYRIFTNNPQSGEIIVKYIAEILVDFGMRLNTQKTLVSNNVIRDSLKSDKLYWLFNKKESKNLQDHLLSIHELSQKHPNSGSLSKALNEFFNRIKNINETKQNISVLISILIDITYKNPRTYPISAAVLSKFISLIKLNQEKLKILESITKKFDKIPNTGHLQIWLQRITIKIDKNKVYKEMLCRKVITDNICIWNSDWLNESLRSIILRGSIIDFKTLEEIDEVIESNEVELFNSKNEY